MNRFVYIKWFALLLVFTILLALTKTTTKTSYFLEQKEAATLTMQAYEAIYNERQARGLLYTDPTRQNEVMDPYESGLLGYWLTNITTTTGDLRAKQLSINPNFAAVVIDMIYKAGLSSGDEIGVVMSGSFPAIGIATLCALEVMNIHTCVIASIGASSYGATIPEFTIFDMMNVLYDQEILKSQLDYVSWGGFNDTGLEYPDDVRMSIFSRIEASSIPLLTGGSFEGVISERMRILNDALPHMSMFINIGGHFASMGQGFSTYLDDNGLIMQGKRLYSSDRGLINRYLEQGLPVIHFINIESLVIEYDLSLSYEPISLDLSSSVYHDEVVNGILLCIPLLISVVIFLRIGFKRKDPDSF
ncbi:MAG: poly-gamma-glutamate system protein [Bacilli bacterium]